MTQPPKWTRIAGWVAIAGGFLFLIAGPLHRFGLVDFRLALLVLALGGLVAAIGALLCLAAVIVAWKRGFSRGFSALGLGVGILAAGGVLSLLAAGRSVPPIHDISTDTTNPPAFVDVLPLRVDAANPPEYPGGDVAAQQAAAYPEIQTLRLTASPAEAFDSAIYAMAALGWNVVGSDPATGRIEATDTTRWFGFTDDIVVRIAAAEDGTHVDIRSKSRVGRSDLGANAKRITAFTGLMK